MTLVAACHRWSVLRRARWTRRRVSLGLVVARRTCRQLALSLDQRTGLGKCRCCCNLLLARLHSTDIVGALRRSAFFGVHLHTLDLVVNHSDLVACSLVERPVW